MNKKIQDFCEKLSFLSYQFNHFSVLDKGAEVLFLNDDIFQQFLVKSSKLLRELALK